MRIAQLAGIYLAAFIATSQIPSAMAQSSGGAEPRKSIEAIVAKFDAAYEAHDAAAIAALYADDGIQVPARPSPTLGALISGRTNIQKFFADAFKVFQHQKQEIVASGIVGNSGAWYVSELHLTGSGQNGPAKIDGHLGVTLVRSGSDWKIVLTTANGAPPAPSAK
jgi:uncharacterized protein (TIGR02246 family)